MYSIMSSRTLSTMCGPSFEVIEINCFLLFRDTNGNLTFSENANVEKLRYILNVDYQPQSFVKIYVQNN